MPLRSQTSVAPCLPSYLGDMASIFPHAGRLTQSERSHYADRAQRLTSEEACGGMPVAMLNRDGWPLLPTRVAPMDTAFSSCCTPLADAECCCCCCRGSSSLLGASWWLPSATSCWGAGCMPHPPGQERREPLTETTVRAPRFRAIKQTASNGASRFFTANTAGTTLTQPNIKSALTANVLFLILLRGEIKEVLYIYNAARSQQESGS